MEKIFLNCPPILLSSRAPQVALVVKNLPANAGDVYSILWLEDPLEERMATHSSILVWRSPWTEEPVVIYRVKKSQTRLKWQHACIYACTWSSIMQELKNYSEVDIGQVPRYHLLGRKTCTQVAIAHVTSATTETGIELIKVRQVCWKLSGWYWNPKSIFTILLFYSYLYYYFMHFWREGSFQTPGQ